PPPVAVPAPHAKETMNDLQKLQTLADEYYRWQFEESPVDASSSGKHDADDRLADYAPAAIERRGARLEQFRVRFEAIGSDPSSPDLAADRALFGSALERAQFARTVLRRERRDPQLYVDECLNGVFSLLKKE